MRYGKSLLAAVLLAMVGTIALTGCGETGGSNPTASSPATPASGAKEKLVMLTSPDYKPYEFFDPANREKIIGFDVDIANYIGKELGFEVEVKGTDFNGLVPALQASRADFVMAGMTPTPERQKNVDFSEIYYEAKNTVFAKKGSKLITEDGLIGKKVGVQLGSTQEGYVKDLKDKEKKNVQIVSLNAIPQIIQELKSGRIDAAIVESTVAEGYTVSNPDLEFHILPNKGLAGSAIAFPKGSKRVADFNKVLQKMKDNGEMKRLVQKWFEPQ